MSETLFVSDIHLDQKRSAVVDLFDDFLKNRAYQADALYILGDLFEYWIGDDADYPHYTKIFNSLKRLSENNIPVYFQHGNRDFLVQKEFCKLTGITILPEEYIANIYGQKILLMHGDTLCTDDVEYQQFRKKTHNKTLQWIVLHLPVRIRQSIANHLRDTSAQAISNKSAEIMDANQLTIEQTMQKHQTKTLVHGHTHRPGIHEFTKDSSTYQRIVLGDWYTQGSVLSFTKENYQLETISF